MRTTLLAVAAAALAWAFSAPSVQAAPIYTYSVTPSPSVLLGPFPPFVITYAAVSNGGSGSGNVGTTNTGVLDIDFFGVGFNLNRSLGFNLTITDTETSATQVVTYTGKLGGSFIIAPPFFFANSLNYSPSAGSPTSFILGGYKYTLSPPVVSNFVYLSLLGPAKHFDVSVNIKAEPIAPEPSSLAVFGLVTLAAGAYGWRRRKQAVTA